MCSAVEDGILTTTHTHTQVCGLTRSTRRQDHCSDWTESLQRFISGDGVVGQLDYFIGKCFDQDADGRLTTAEKRRAEKAWVGARGPARTCSAVQWTGPREWLPRQVCTRTGRHWAGSASKNS